VKKEEEEEVDIDLGDPEVEKAALKIQSGFRGHMARQEIRQKKVKGVVKVTGSTTLTLTFFLSSLFCLLAR
jgi:uncharacterized membrane protein